MADRMSPSDQTAKRVYAAQQANVKTGDADMDSLLSKEISRRATFGLAEASKPAHPNIAHPASNPNVFQRLMQMFNKPKGK